MVAFLRKRILACTYIVIPYAENFYEICVTNNSASFLRCASYKWRDMLLYNFLGQLELRPLQILREELMGLKYIVLVRNDWVTIFTFNL